MSTPPPVWPPQPGSPSPYGAPQSSSNATLILVLGIVSIFFLQIILGPIAWILGNNALKTGMVDPAQAGQINTGAHLRHYRHGFGSAWDHRLHCLFPPPSAAAPCITPALFLSQHLPRQAVPNKARTP